MEIAMFGKMRLRQVKESWQTKSEWLITKNLHKNHSTASATKRAPHIPSFAKEGMWGIGVKLRNSWDGMDCTDVLTGRLYVCPCLLVIHKSTKSYRRCGKPLSPAGWGLRGWTGISRSFGRFIA